MVNVRNDCNITYIFSSISHFIIPFSSKLPLLITTFYYIILLVKDNKKVGYGMEKPKSKGIFWVLSIIADIFSAFSFSVER